MSRSSRGLSGCEAGCGESDPPSCVTRENRRSRNCVASARPWTRGSIVSQKDGLPGRTHGCPGQLEPAPGQHLVLRDGCRDVNASTMSADARALSSSNRQARHVGSSFSINASDRSSSSIASMPEGGTSRPFSAAKPGSTGHGQDISHHVSSISRMISPPTSLPTTWRRRCGEANPVC